MRERSALDALADQWDALLFASRAGGDNSHPFLSHGWVTAHLDTFEPTADLRVAAAWEDGRLAALAPLVLRRVRRFGRIPLPGPLGIRVLSTPANPHTPRGGWLLGRHPDAAMEALFGAIEEQDDWDVLEVRDVPLGSATERRLCRVARAHGFLVGEWPSMDSPFIRLPVEEPAGAFGRELRRRMRHLERLGTMRLRRIDGNGSDAGSIAAALDEGFGLEAAGWKARRGTAVNCEDTLREFYRRVALWAAARGWLRLDFLEAGGRAIGFHFSLAEGGRHFLLKPGFDPAMAAFGPGHVLLWLVLRHLMDTGCVELDLLGDDAAWKRQWTRRVRRHVWIHVFRPGPRGAVLHALKYGPAGRLLSSSPVGRRKEEGGSGDD